MFTSVASNFYRMSTTVHSILSQKYKVVLLRHGESTWNKANRFTGWTDVRLSSAGIQ
jgi:hypothetical protein